MKKTNSIHARPLARYRHAGGRPLKRESTREKPSDRAPLPRSTVLRNEKGTCRGARLPEMGEVFREGTMVLGLEGRQTGKVPGSTARAILASGRHVVYYSSAPAGRGRRAFPD